MWTLTHFTIWESLAYCHSNRTKPQAIGLGLLDHGTWHPLQIGYGFRGPAESSLK